MYFDATLSIDPSQTTRLKRVPPTQGFARLLHLLTGGRTGDQEEVETFTAVSILQQLQVALRGLGITNVVRLARDGRNFYLDTRGRDDDLAEALESFEQLQTQNDAPFASLKLVLSHRDHANDEDDDSLHYLIEIDIDRAHQVDRDPIVVGVSAVVAALKGTTRAEVLPKLEPVFADQSAYDAFVARYRQRFDAFIVQLSGAIAATIPSDRFGTETRQMIVQASERVDDTDRLRSRRVMHGEEDEGWGRMFHGYVGIDAASLYAWLWAELAHERRLRLREFTLVSDTGRVLCEVGTAGVDAADNEGLLPGPTSGRLVGDDVRIPSAPVGATAPTAPNPDASWLGGMFEGGTAASAPSGGDGGQAGSEGG